MDERPEALLKSALEKIVYFEARSEQLTNDLEAARSECERLKRELAAASQREIELRRQTAELEVKVNRAHLEREELGRVNEALRAERAQQIGKLLEASRIHDADRPRVEGEEEPLFDLASFISELRGEFLAARAPEAKASAAPAVAAVASPAASPAPAVRPAATAVAQHAERLHAEGRLQVSRVQVLELTERREAFPGRSEETLFGFSVRELSAPDGAARVRAAERLKALGHPAAAPALATALHAETDPRVQVALLNSFASFAPAEGVAIVTPLLTSEVPDVRIAALKALIAIDAAQAGPHLAAAMKDPDRAVRRRASLLALGLSGDAALQLGQEAIRDGDPEVRGLAALVLGASGGERCRSLLQEALRDPEAKVRQAAARSLSRILGQDVSSLVSMDEAQRRREVRRLSALPARPVTRAPASIRRPVHSMGASTSLGPSGVAALAPSGVTALSPSGVEAQRRSTPPVEARTDGPPPPPAQAQPAPPRVVSEALCGAVMMEIRTAIRGRSVADLVSGTRADREAVEEACALLCARGQVVRRGAKFFAA